MSEKTHLLNREFVLITFLGFLYFYLFHSFLLLPVRLVEIGADEKTIGFVMGIAGLSTLFLTPWVGSLADKYGKKIFITSGIFVLSLSTLPFMFLDEVNFYYYLLRIFHGVSFSLFFVAAGALTADVSPENKRTQAIGIYGVFTILNYALAPYIGTLIMNNYGFNSFIIYLTLIGIIGFVFSFFLRNELIDKKLLRKIDNYSYLSCMKKREVIVSSLTLFFCGSAFVATLNFISIFALSIDIKNFHIYFISYTLSVLFIRIFFGWVPDKIGKWFITLPALFVFGLSVLLLGFVTDIKLLLLAGILFGVGHGFAYPSIYSIIIENNPIEARAKSFAISSLSFTSGGMIGSFIFGLIADYFNFRIMFFVIAMVVFITFIMFGHNYKKLSAEGIKL